MVFNSTASSANGGAIAYSEQDSTTGNFNAFVRLTDAQGNLAGNLIEIDSPEPKRVLTPFLLQIPPVAIQKIDLTRDFITYLAYTTLDGYYYTLGTVDWSVRFAAGKKNENWTLEGSTIDATAHLDYHPNVERTSTPPAASTGPTASDGLKVVTV
jgi:hypothetical protein